MFITREFDGLDATRKNNEMVEWSNEVPPRSVN